MERAKSQAKAFGSYDPSSLAYHVGQVKFELVDIAGSIESLEEADRMREPAFRRTHARYDSMLAERKLRVGRLEEACRDWHKTLDDYQHVQSGRCDDRISAMMTAIRLHLRNGHAQALYERARPLAPAT